VPYLQLSDFAGAYIDPLYGRMVRQRSLKDILGDDAKKYYPKPKPKPKPLAKPKPASAPLFEVREN
jgi:hypothetical protein